jgi:hypothetical protein
MKDSKMEDSPPLVPLSVLKDFIKGMMSDLKDELRRELHGPKQDTLITTPSRRNAMSESSSSPSTPSTPPESKGGQTMNFKQTQHFHVGNPPEDSPPRRRSPQHSSVSLNNTKIDGKGNGNQKVPLEYSHNLPTRIPLVVKSAEADSFLLWRDQIITSIEKIPKFTGILSQSPKDNWKYFCSRNSSKYDINELQNSYIDCHMEIYGFIMECLDIAHAAQIERSFKEDKAIDLSVLLNFTVKHPASYKNANGLLSHLEKYHVQSSRAKRAEVLSQLCLLKYDGRTDPRDFIRNLHDIQNKGRVLGGIDWPTFTDQGWADLIFGKLIGNSLSQLRQNIISHEKIQKVTGNDMEDMLIQWWLSNEQNKNSNPNTNKPPYQGKQQQNGQQQSKSHPKDTSNPPKDSANPAVIPPKGNKKSGKPKDSKVKTADQSEEGESPREGQTSHDDDEFLGVAIAEPVCDDTIEFAHSTLKEVYSKNYIPERHEMLWDTGATVSMTPLEEHVEDPKKIPPIKISTMSGSVHSQCVGTFRFPGRLRVENIHVIPKAPYSLLSLSRATANGAIAVFTADAAYLIPPNSRNNPIIDICEKHTLIVGKRKGNLWVTEMASPDKSNEERHVREKLKQTHILPPRKVPLKKDNPISIKIRPKANSNEEKKESAPPPKAKVSLAERLPPSSSSSPSVPLPSPLKTPVKNALSANPFNVLDEPNDEPSPTDSPPRDNDDSEEGEY